MEVWFEVWDDVMWYDTGGVWLAINLWLAAAAAVQRSLANELRIGTTKIFLNAAS